MFHVTILCRMVVVMADLTRRDWVLGALDIATERGFDGIAIEPLAQRLGVTKGSFYWHFENRKALLEALLETWEQVGTEVIIREVEDEAGSPIERLHRLALRTTSPTRYDRFDGVIREAAARDPEIHRVIARIDERRLSYVESLLTTTGLSPSLAKARAHVFYRVLIGEFLWRSAGGRPLTQAAITDVVDLLIEHTD